MRARHQSEVDLKAGIVLWLLRLPLLRADEMSLLLGVDETLLRRALSEMERLGWVEWILSRSPELEARRRLAWGLGGGVSTPPFR